MAPWEAAMMSRAPKRASVTYWKVSGLPSPTAAGEAHGQRRIEISVFVGGGAGKIDDCHNGWHG
uniref:Uncharacterized protein n=1 Tax=Candidatus Kentrum sp. SD TaxID=2126332 RepID=A0A451BQ94_9GAMM|nr:MAG: hypothetical protein BECKSD772F_GA0070984_11258 [Candidatus Kentron sp. SD]VFK48391.1 MAG: hypothetical protein BECKSD772E_GA0070983_11238 [Candidatus Kentron sp. SD]VFK80479.1 MAG: hypothetical protein BECKSD772D_GA0070982_11193 [Candidatus Kentron sp. SD]